MNEMNTAELKVKEVIQEVHTRIFQGSIPEVTMNKLVKNISKVYNTHARMKAAKSQEPSIAELTIELGHISSL